MNTRALLCLLVTFAMGCATAWGQSPSAPDAAQSAAREQEALRERAEKIRDDFIILKTEMQAFIPDELSAVDTPAGEMAALARSDLERVESYLQAAERETNALRRVELLNAARSSQAAIERRLEAIWKQLGAPLAAAELLTTVRVTARQQAVAQSEARRLAARPGDEETRKRQQALQREQERLAMVAGQINDRLEALNPAWTNRQLEADARAAADALKAGDNTTALAEQAQALASLQAMMKGLNPNAGERDLERLGHVQRELDVLANMQRSANGKLERGESREALAELERAASLASALTPAAAELSPAAAGHLKEATARTEAMANALAAAARGGQATPAHMGDAAKAAAAATDNARDAVASTMKGDSAATASSTLGMSATAIRPPAPGGSGEGKQAGNSPSPHRMDAEGTSRQPQGGGLGESEGDVAGSGGTIESAQVVDGLSPREREAAAQLQSVHPPAEFAPDVGQYFKNLADGVMPGDD